jgi:hypothetical protein
MRSRAPYTFQSYQDTLARNLASMTRR